MGGGADVDMTLTSITEIQWDQRRCGGTHANKPAAGEFLALGFVEEKTDFPVSDC
jgi:hypothetical protein